MMLLFKRRRFQNFYLKLFVVLFTTMYGVLNKYTFEANYKETTNLGSLMKSYAMNMADTKMLKITNQNHRNDFAENKKKIDDNLVNQYGSVFGGSSNREEGNVYSGSVLISEKGELTFSQKFIDPNDTTRLKGRKLIARAKYTKSLAQIGWSKLYVETFDSSSPEVQSWAAGFLEGKLTAREILDFYKNLVGIHSKESDALQDVFEYYKKVEESIRYRTSKQVLSNVSEEKELEYWISVSLVQAQTDGLHAGYNSIMKEHPLTFAQIYFINADGEVPELITVFKTKKESKNFSQYSFKEGKTKSFLSNRSTEKFSKEYLQFYFGSSDPEFVWNKLMSRSHCSAIIKVLTDETNSLKDILVAHTTWDSFAEMHRIFKEYKFSYTMYGIKKKESTITFSSYPGTLTSTDDFYLLNRKIVVLETTLEMLDRSLYETKIPQAEEHVPNYIRISVANRLSSSGREWTEIFRLNNGGTYNSQWMILDFNKFKQPNNNQQGSLNQKLFPDNKDKEQFVKNYNELSGVSFNSYFNNLNFSFKEKMNLNEVSSDLFIILEQIPGYIEVRDMTDHLLKRGFWASYNRPYFEKIYREAGYYGMMKKYGRTYSYEDNPRAQIINKNINNVNSIEDLKILMQMNRNFKNDDYINTISPRYDLTTNQGLRRPAGGIDTKIVSSQLVKEQSVLAISGPSKYGGAQPFRWSDWPDEPHHGLPEVYDFDWVKFNDKYIKNE